MRSVFLAFCLHFKQCVDSVLNSIRLCYVLLEVLLNVTQYSGSCFCVCAFLFSTFVVGLYGYDFCFELMHFHCFLLSVVI